jgi:hypothetical protein
LSSARAGSNTPLVPCLLGCLALSFPRFVLLVVWLTSDYLEWAYETKLWPVLGWIFMPTTTLAYAFAMHYGNRAWTPIGIGAVVVAVLIDLGLLGSSRRKRGPPDRDGGPPERTPPPDGTREIVVEGRRVG